MPEASGYLSCLQNRLLTKNGLGKLLGGLESLKAQLVYRYEMYILDKRGYVPL